MKSVQPYLLSGTYLYKYIYINVHCLNSNSINALSRHKNIFTQNLHETSWLIVLMKKKHKSKLIELNY